MSFACREGSNGDSDVRRTLGVLYSSIYPATSYFVCGFPSEQANCVVLIVMLQQSQRNILRPFVDVAHVLI